MFPRPAKGLERGELLDQGDSREEGKAKTALIT